MKEPRSVSVETIVATNLDTFRHAWKAVEALIVAQAPGPDDGPPGPPPDPALFPEELAAYRKFAANPTPAGEAEVQRAMRTFARLREQRADRYPRKLLTPETARFYRGPYPWGDRQVPADDVYPMDVLLGLHAWPGPASEGVADPRTRAIHLDCSDMAATPLAFSVVALLHDERHYAHGTTPPGGWIYRHLPEPPCFRRSAFTAHWYERVLAEPREFKPMILRSWRATNAILDGRKELVYVV